MQSKTVRFDRSQWRISSRPFIERFGKAPSGEIIKLRGSANPAYTGRAELSEVDADRSERLFRTNC